jgi:ribosomal protein S18 acetylase RimI-like enzyme
MNLSIRRASYSDAALIADISRQTFFDTFAPDNTKKNMDKFLSQQFTKSTLMMEVGLKEHTFVLAYADDVIAGYVKLRDGKKPLGLKVPSIEIARLYACSQFIGNGVGKLLMQASVNEAISKGKEMIWLCVWEKNQRAINFYTAWGFEKFGECEFILGDDVQQDWMMKKNLTNDLLKPL